MAKQGSRQILIDNKIEWKKFLMGMKRLFFFDDRKKRKSVDKGKIF